MYVRSLDPFYIVTFYIKWVKTSWKGSTKQISKRMYLMYYVIESIPYIIYLKDNIKPCLLDKKMSFSPSPIDVYHIVGITGCKT